MTRFPFLEPAWVYQSLVTHTDGDRDFLKEKTRPSCDKGTKVGQVETPVKMLFLVSIVLLFPLKQEENTFSLLSCTKIF